MRWESEQERKGERECRFKSFRNIYPLEIQELERKTDGLVVQARFRVLLFYLFRFQTRAKY